MERLKLHLNRLKRHYEHSLYTYDDVSLCDLSHILRMWTEIAEELVNNKEYLCLRKFKSASYNKKLLRLLKGNDYLLVDLPPDTRTYATRWTVYTGPKGTETATGGVKFKFNTNEKSMDFRAMYAFYNHKYDGMPKLMEKNKVGKHNISQWMGIDVVRYRYTDEDHSIIEDKISRNKLIKRIANTMDGSHPSKEQNPDSKNKFNKHVDHLMKYRLGGLPLPYFILLNTAQQILSVFDKEHTDTI
ncbi:MAG: hypothetical protein JAY74_26010 [Candidatus Thiodiazotropha taylori]|nr:hypothetical protein [Candidatus Thiodiazotropha taylori]